MATATKPRSSSQWADALAIVTGVALLGVSIWPSITASSDAGQAEVRNVAAMVLVRIAAGAIAIGAVFVAQRAQRRPMARGMLIAAALLLIGGLVIFRDFGPWSLGTMVLPAVLLLVSAMRIGPLPD